MAGIFSLRDARTLQIRNIVDKNLNSFPESNAYGYFGGGQVQPSHVNTIDRIDFSTQTVSIPGKKLTAQKSRISAVSNSSYGYFGGGYFGPAPSITFSSFDRLEFSTETIIVPSRRLPSTKSQGAATSNTFYGYFAGGPVNSTIDRLDFSTEITSTISPKLSQARYYFSATSSNLYGYFGGGFTASAQTSVIDRLDFSTETVTRPSSNLSKSKFGLSATSSNYYGYFIGGGQPDPLPGTISIIDRLDFITETITNSNTLPTGYYQSTATSNNSYGYIAGRNGSPESAQIDRLDFNTEIVGSIGSLSQGRNLLASVSSKQSQRTLLQTTINPISNRYGYFGGGININTIDRLDFSTETTSAPGKNLTQARSNLSATSSSLYGYFAGGADNITPLPTNLIDRLDFSTETPSAPGKNLTQAKNSLAAASSSLYGYFAGGSITGPSNINTIDRLDFSTETTSSPGKNLLQLGIASLSATSNNSYAYFGGGSDFTSVRLCTISRLDFSSETVTVRAPTLSQARNALTAVTSNSYGYFGGGFAPSVPGVVNTIDRLDLSTETRATPGTYQLSQIKSNLAAVSSSSYGYFGGGYSPTPAIVYSTIDRLDFSTETRSTPGNYQLTQARNTLAGTQVGRQKVNVKFRTTVGTYGYFGGGTQPLVPLSCSLDRLDFSTETVSTPTPTLTQGRFSLAALSNNFYGYFAGGSNPTPARSCLIDRIDFYNETTSAPGKSLTEPRQGSSTVSNNSFGYFLGGTNATVRTSTIDRLDFSNETTLTSTAKLPTAKDGSAGVSNSSYGYLVGGFPGPTPGTGNDSTINRLDFLSETVSIPSFRVVSNISSSLASVSSASYGYFAGGFEAGNPTPTNICIIERLDLSTETTSQPSKLITQQRYSLAAVSSASYGYFGGGNTPTPSILNTIDRIDFFTETVSVPGKNLLIPRTNVAAVSNNQIASTAKKGFAPFSATYGYLVGGVNPTPTVFCTVDRLDFSTEVLSQPGKNLSSGKVYSYNSEVISSSYGYFVSGNTPGNTINRLEFLTETLSLPGKNISDALGDRGAAVSSPSYGYWGGGRGPESCVITRFDFSNENISLPGKNLTVKYALHGAVSNTSYGYFSAGSPGGGIYESIVNRLDFSTESCSDTRYRFPNAAFNRYSFVTLSSASYGYFCGGFYDTSNVDRLDFSTETFSLPGNNLGPGGLSRGADGASGLETTSYGYICSGGSTPTGLSSNCIINRLDFYNDTFSSPGKNLSAAKYRSAGLSSAYKPPIRNGWGWRKTYGYFGGGYTNSTTPTTFSCTIERLDFSTETVSNPQNKLSKGRRAPGSVSSPSYAYFVGGYFPGGTPSCTIDRLDFSTGGITGLTIYSSRNAFGSASNASYGYFAAGGPSALTCSIDRLDFTTEVITPNVSYLSLSKQYFCSTVTANYGYFGGGGTPSTVFNTIDRLDFSTNIVLTPGTYNLSTARESLMTVYNGSYGYYMGGNSPGVPIVTYCTIDRMNFSTETISTITSLSRPRYFAASIQSSSYGYIAIGWTPTAPGRYTCSIDRLDFTTESNLVVSASGSQAVLDCTGIDAT